MWRYKDSTNESGVTLDEYENKAKKQDDLILALFRKFPLVPMTPPEVNVLLGTNSHMLLTSVRRSLNSLTNLGYLERLDSKRKGIYGRMNYQWKLK